VNDDRVDLAIIGAGAAGLTAAIAAAERSTEAGRALRIALLDSQKKPGAKILVSGGGRCNVTNDRVVPEDYWGGNRRNIAHVLRAFTRDQAVAWFARLGVELKLEPTGKMFPVTDSARTVLNALMRRIEELGVQTRFGYELDKLERDGDGFLLHLLGENKLPSAMQASRVIMATGGKSLPKSGSNGHGLIIARRLGHEMIATTPALVPLTVDSKTPCAAWAGITMDATAHVSSATGKPIETVSGSLLFTHTGISGPVALDASRHWLRARLEAPEAGLPRIALRPMNAPWKDALEADKWLMEKASASPGMSAASVLFGIWPARLIGDLIDQAKGPNAPLAQWPRDARKRLSGMLGGWKIPVVADRGWAFAETTAGGVSLESINSKTMQSRVVPGLYFVGEMLDVDGRLGGFNFQWAWSSGWVAGRAAEAAAGIVNVE